MTMTTLSERYVVHELLTAQDSVTSCFLSDLHPGEAVGTDIVSKENGLWPEFTSHGRLRVDAGPVVHRAPCLGYVFREVDTSQRKIVVLGDTCDPSAMTELSRGACVLVHEATDTHIPPSIDPKLGGNRKTPEGIRERMISRGHSTPEMAGSFAKSIGAKKLILNHFSAKYPAPTFHSGKRVDVMAEIERQASTTWGSGQAHAAFDFMQVSIPASGIPLGPFDLRSRQPRHSHQPSTRGSFRSSQPAWNRRRGRGHGEPSSSKAD